MDPITAWEVDTLAACTRVWQRDGRLTVRTVAAEMHCSLSVAHERLHVLAERGLLAYEDARRPSFRLTYHAEPLV